MRSTSYLSRASIDENKELRMTHVPNVMLEVNNGS